MTIANAMLDPFPEKEVYGCDVSLATPCFQEQP
jgi:hypothetical protein